MIPSWAVKGADCICIKQGAWELVSGRDTGGVPAYREICRIASVTIYRGEAYLVLEGYGASQYAACRFRPVKTQEDDIATHFEHHLHNDHRAPETVA